MLQRYFRALADLFCKRCRIIIGVSSDIAKDFAILVITLRNANSLIQTLFFGVPPGHAKQNKI
jgi:hypothetical protein